MRTFTSTHSEPRRSLGSIRTYLRGILDRFRKRIISVVLYGSFGRGDYGSESDVDLLLVIDEFEWSEGLRVREADELTYEIWKLRGKYHKVAPYPLTPEQGNRHRPLYLDLPGIRSSSTTRRDSSRGSWTK